MQVYKYASIQVCKHASWKVYMQLSKNKGMHDVCMQLGKYVDLQILNFESMEIFMYKRIKVYKCAYMQISRCLGMPLCIYASIQKCQKVSMKEKTYASF